MKRLAILSMTFLLALAVVQIQAQEPKKVVKKENRSERKALRKLVGTTAIKTFADLPPKGQKVIQTKYKDYSIGPVIFYNDNEFNESDMLLYGLQFEDEDNYFVELTKGNSKIIVRVDPMGVVYFFKQL